MSHLEARLEKDLNRIRSLIGEQANRVEESIRNAVHALQTGNRKLAYANILADHPINRRMRQIDRLCHSFIAVHLPSAGHLRLMSSVIRTNIELERIGDYAVVISREAVQLTATPSGVMARELERMTGETMLMLRQSIKAFTDLNAEVARSTMPIADQIESDMDLIYGELIDSTEQPAIKDLLALFVVFNQLKRVADQAKNICEETVFAVTGDQKAPKVYNILFIDEDNGCLSPIAEAIASNQYPESGRYRSAGRNPAEQLDPTLVGFLNKRGIDLAEKRPAALDLTHRELAEQHVIVSLQGPVQSYISPIPFHSTALEWDLGPAPEAGNEQRVEELYREIALQIKDLMELLRGEGAS